MSTSSRGGTYLSGRSAQVTHHVLDPGVLLEPVHRKVLTVPGMSIAAVRHFRHERQMGINPYGTEIQPPGNPHGDAVVLRPDAGGEAEPDVVGPAHRLFFGVEFLD